MQEHENYEEFEIQNDITKNKTEDMKIPSEDSLYRPR